MQMEKIKIVVLSILNALAFTVLAFVFAILQCTSDEVLVAARFQVQYDQYLSNSSYLQTLISNENTGHIVQGKLAITSLSLTYKISIVC